VAACDGEKDPRNVLLVCELWALLPHAFCGAGTATPAHAAAFAAAAEELYDVVAMYFPAGAYTRQLFSST